MRHYPHLYEVNTCLFIKRMSRKYGRALTLATVPDEEWQLLVRRGFDLLWLMGVWQRSLSARQRALVEPGLQQEYGRALPGWTAEDIAGSPYAVYSYTLNPSLGEPKELAQLKSKLNKQGLGLILDFVPNHLACDHPWTFSHPEWFVQGSKTDALMHPDWFFSTDKGVYLAHGRDPNFPPWTDTVQMNFYSADLRKALISELLRVAEVADGVRCDMAMLTLNDVFEKVWGEVLKGYPRQVTEFWVEAIEQVKKRRPDFLFVAEAYWGLEQRLQKIGFDFTYDKSFYDKLRFSNPQDIRGYLEANISSHQRSVRFIENHDEPRAVTAFGRERSLAAAVVLTTVPGLRLYHDGQLEGRMIRLPVQLQREPVEGTDPEIEQFYNRLLSVGNTPAFHEGQWEPIEVSKGGEDNSRHQNLLTWGWHYAGQFKIVIVNYSPNPAQGWLKLHLPTQITERATLRHEFTGTMHIGHPEELSDKGLFVDLGPWQARIFNMDVAPGSHP